MQTALILLMLAMLAAIQARAIRGTRRHHLQELCRSRGCPEAYDEIMTAGGTIAFVAASVVVITAVLATLVISQQPLKDSPPFWLASGWTLLCWVMLVIIPTLTTRLAGGWVVATTWWLWRPLVRLAGPLMMVGRSVFQLISCFVPGRGTSDADESQDEIRLAMEEAHRGGHLDEEARVKRHSLDYNVDFRTVYRSLLQNWMGVPASAMPEIFPSQPVNFDPIAFV